MNPAIVDDFLPLLRAGDHPRQDRGPAQSAVQCATCPRRPAGGTIKWVGELKPKPVSAMAFAMENLAFNKVAAIVVLSQELVRFSNPSAEAVVRDSLVEDIAAFLDGAVHQPGRGRGRRRQSGIDHERRADRGGDGESAGRHHRADQSLRHQQHPDRRADVHHVARRTRLRCRSAPTSTARRNSRASAINGGTYKGLQFITSNTVTTNVVALAPQYILYADDGGVTIDASTEASLQMDSAPASPVDATTVYASMFQMNAVALRAERYIDLEARRRPIR